MALIRPGTNQIYGLPIKGQSHIQPPSGGGGGGGGGYVAKAVHFDGATGLAISSMTAPDSAVCSVVYWAKASAPSNAILWVVDPDGDYATYDAVNEQGIHLPSYTSATTFGSADGSLNVTTNDANEPYLHDDVWNCVIKSVDVQNQVAGCYVNGLSSLQDFPLVTGSPFSMLFSGKGFKLADDGFEEAFTGDIADFRFMPGISLLDGDGNIPDATLRLFIDANGKPVDPAVAVAALWSPTVLFSGDHTAFATNQGVGGAFTLTGTLTDATTSPSD